MHREAGHHDGFVAKRSHLPHRQRHTYQAHLRSGEIARGKNKKGVVVKSGRALRTPLVTALWTTPSGRNKIDHLGAGHFLGGPLGPGTFRIRQNRWEKRKRQKEDQEDED